MIACAVGAFGLRVPWLNWRLIRAAYILQFSKHWLEVAVSIGNYGNEADVPMTALLSSSAGQRDTLPAVANHIYRVTPQHEGLRRLAVSARFRLRVQGQQLGRN